MSPSFITSFYQSSESENLSQVKIVSEKFPTDLTEKNKNGNLEQLFREDRLRKAINTHITRLISSSNYREDTSLSIRYQNNKREAITNPILYC